MPPLCSTVRIARVDRRRRTDAPSTSDSREVSCRLGRKRRRVLLLAWLTLLPVSTPLPVISQRRDIRGHPWASEGAGYGEAVEWRQAAHSRHERASGPVDRTTGEPQERRR